MIYRKLYGIVLIGILMLPFVSWAQVKHVPHAKSHKISQKDIYGEWEVVRYSHSQLIKSATEEDWKECKGKKILIDSNMVVLAGDTCKAPEYTVSRQNTFWYFYNGYREKSGIGIKDDTVTVIEVGCKKEPVGDRRYVRYFQPDFLITSRGDVIWCGELFIYLRKVK